MENFIVALNAVIPFIFYMGMGYLARRFGVVDGPMLTRMNRMCFKMFFPFIMFYNIYDIDLRKLADPVYLGFLIVMVIAAAGAAFLIVPRIIKENPRRGVIIQALYRGNYILFGIPLAISVCGEDAAEISAMGVAVVVPLYNILSIVILEYFNVEGDEKRGAAEILLGLAKNPLLQGAALGIVFCVLRIGLPECIRIPVGAIANMTSPLAIFILGGSFYFGQLKKNVKYISVTVFLRLVVLPAIALILAWSVGLRDARLFCAFAVFATPVAAASYPMAQNMGGDGELAGQILAISTVTSLFTLFFWIYGLKCFGVL